MRGTEFRETAHRLYPLPVEEVPEGGVYSDLRLPNFVLPQDRPYIMINVVSSLDGKAAIEGRAGDIGGEADRRAMRNLRAIADAVMIGGGTLRAEKLSLGLPEDLQKLRASQGRGRQPLAVILTSTGSIPIRSNLLHNTIDNTLVLLPENAPQIPDQATIERLPHRQ